jgi:hypothetical protein
MSTGIASAFEAERMNITVEAPELSRALVALEQELRIDPRPTRAGEAARLDPERLRQLHRP